MFRPQVAGLIVVALATIQGCATKGPPSPGGVDGIIGVDTATPGTRSQGADVVMTALQYIDLPYRAGGLSQDDGFDCSGFTRHVYAQSTGIMLPRQADDQAQSAGLQEVRRQHLRPGDLVFFNTLRRTYSHVGIYVGDDRFIHAPRTGAQVRIESMRTPYWARRFTGARRAELP